VIDRHVTLAAAGFVVSGEPGDALQQSGFASAVFADNDRDQVIETQFEVSLQERQAERIDRTVGDARWVEPDAA
jgi:hypothetical protein